MDKKYPKPVECYTDYPFYELGDKPGTEELAPIRKVTAMCYDDNKYCSVKVEGIEKFKMIKSGYLYLKPERMTWDYFPEKLSTETIRGLSCGYADCENCKLNPVFGAMYINGVLRHEDE